MKVGLHGERCLRLRVNFGSRALLPAGRGGVKSLNFQRRICTLGLEDLEFKLSGQDLHAMVLRI